MSTFSDIKTAIEDNWLLYYLVSSALCWYVGLVSKVAKEIFNEPRREYVAISGLWYFFSFLFFSFLNIHSHKHWKAGCCILENFSFSHFKSPCSPSKFLDCYRNLNVEKKVLEMELWAMEWRYLHAFLDWHMVLTMKTKDTKKSMHLFCPLTQTTVTPILKNK